jgi:hypothetical protein
VLRQALLIRILRLMAGSAADAPKAPDSGPHEQLPEMTVRPGELRASDDDRDQAIGELREHFAAGRLSHDTFMGRMNTALDARHQADLPPLFADLPGRRPRGWLSSGWAGSVVHRLLGVRARSPAGPRASSRRRRPPAGSPAASSPPRETGTRGIRLRAARCPRRSRCRFRAAPRPPSPSAGTGSVTWPSTTSPCRAGTPGWSGKRRPAGC